MLDGDSIFGVLIGGVIDGFVTTATASLIVTGGTLAASDFRSFSFDSNFIGRCLAGIVAFVVSRWVGVLLPPYEKPIIKTGPLAKDLFSLLTVIIQSLVNTALVFGVLGEGVVFSAGAWDMLLLAIAGFVGLVAGDLVADFV